MPLTDAEKTRALYHLGYPAYTTAASLALGVPVFTQPLWVAQTNLNNLLEPAVDQVRSISTVMDNIETKLIEAQDRLAAEKLDEITLRADETDRLEGEYRRWGYRLADVTGSPIYPYSMRYKMGGGNTVSSVPIRWGS